VYNISILIIVNRKPVKNSNTNYINDKIKLENVAVANALQIHTDRATPVPSRFSYDAMPRLTSLNLSIHCRIIAILLLKDYFML